MVNNYTSVTLKERQDLKDELNKLQRIGWVKFMRESPISAKYWDKLLSRFPGFQFILLDEESKAIACGNSIPFQWDGHTDSLPTGWDGVFEKGILDYDTNKQPHTLSAIAIVIHPQHRNKGLSRIMVKEMRDLAIKGNFKNMVAPVRPSLKSKYPLIPMEEYIGWKREDGTPFDPWIRTHFKLGASIIKVAEKSMVIPAPIELWEEWTDMKFPSTGRYVIDDGLAPLYIDKSANRGVYTEPNVWMRHYLD